MSEHAHKPPNQLESASGTLAIALSVGLGALILFLAASLGYRQLAFAVESRTAHGTVTKVEQTQSMHKGGVRITDWPIISFPNAAGNTVTFKPKETWDFLHYAIGQKVDVLYLPDEPASAQIDSFVPLFGIPVFTAFIGAAFIVLPFRIKKNWQRDRRKHR
ncbi:DUF3592 domain-containing protein [Dyella acidiphila]|uniref:DUF3592 domain-containing protein n=1 Tax=Dyella acidiphila TaxID=2775866 RepID=A0ABR9G788_9GAMM|nr:DUF3592 domain-containing protein [Dyella acidiphila]MBE1159914.1 DUF3592 domain-containing protein [Dyella acidiphila]